jgi:LuxR family maltose regulon positive regulatory protein
VQHLAFEHVRGLVDAALATEDAVGAVAAVRPVARALAAEHGADFRDLIAGLPESAWHDDAVIASAMGASYRAAGSPRGSAAIRYFEAAEAALATAGRDRDAERVTVRLGHAAALRMAGQLEAAVGYVESARDLDRPGGPLSVALRVELGARCLLEGGILSFHLGDMVAARRQLEAANGLADSLTRAERIECLGGLALVEFGASRLESASRHIAEARDLSAGTTLAGSGYAAPALVAQILVAVDRHDLEAAATAEAAARGASRGTDWKPLCYVAVGYQRLASRKFVDGLDVLERAQQAYLSWVPAGFGRAAEEQLRASILVQLDHGDQAWSILRGIQADEHHIVCPARIVGQLRLSHGDLRGAAAALEGCEAIAEAHSPRTMVEVRMLRAAIEYERGELLVSDTVFDRCLVAMARTGSRAGLRRIPPGTLAGLAARALTRNHGTEAIGILQRIADATAGGARPIEPLSTRELLVLAEVEKGTTVAGIAASLFISPNTVKTHLRRLYRKLGVTTRSDAIRKAKSLGLGRSITRDSPE